MSIFRKTRNDFINSKSQIVLSKYLQTENNSDYFYVYGFTARVGFGAADSVPPIRRRRFGAGHFGAEHFGAGTIWCKEFFFRFVFL